MRTPPPACTPSRTRSLGTTTSSSNAAVSASRCMPDEVDFKLEIEIGEDERELEVELTW